MKKTEKPARPELIRLTAADMPKQSTDTQVAEGDTFRIFSRRIDLFYVFEESKVKRIQNHVKDAVDQLLEEQTNCTRKSHLFKPTLDSFWSHPMQAGLPLVKKIPFNELPFPSIL